MHVIKFHVEVDNVAATSITGEAFKGSCGPVDDERTRPPVLMERTKPTPPMPAVLC